MHVWMLKTGEAWPLDAATRLGRTGQLTKALLARGHKVTWWTSSFEHRTKRHRGIGEWSLETGLTVIAMRGVGYQRNVALGRYIGNLALAAQFSRLARQRQTPDLVLASLPCQHLALAGASYARSYRCRLVVDYRDRWPDIFAQALPFLPDRVARGVLAWDFSIQRRAFSLADALVGISPQYVDEAVKRAGRPRREVDRHFYLGAYRPNSQDDVSIKGLRDVNGKRLLVYAGAYGLTYDLTTIIEASRRLARERGDFALVMCGSGDRDVGMMLKGHPSAVDVGWLDAKALASLLRRAHVGLMPFRAGAPQSVPNKAFDYFAAGLPIISTLEGEMEALLAQRGLGLHSPPGKITAMQQAMRRMLDDIPAHAEWSVNATRFFEEEGNSETIYEKYADFLESLAATPSASSI